VFFCRQKWVFGERSGWVGTGGSKQQDGKIQGVRYMMCGGDKELGRDA
jgi:hypothetical protein